VIPIPDPFEVEEIGEIPFVNAGTDLTWNPVVDGATLDITIVPITADCLALIAGEPGAMATRIDDTGSYRFDSDVYHSPHHDFTYELTFARRAVSTVSATWFKDGGKLPANDIWAIGAAHRSSRVRGRPALIAGDCAPDFGWVAEPVDVGMKPGNQPGQKIFYQRSDIPSSNGENPV
jgi:hypothetical protein